MSEQGGGLEKEILKTTALTKWHIDNGATMGPFVGSNMPIRYKEGDKAAHLGTRKFVGGFDTDHMGNFWVSGENAPAFLNYGLTNNVNALIRPGMAQYHVMQNTDGTAIDDAYVYRVGKKDYILVVNASNKEKDFKHLSQFLPKFPGVDFRDVSDDLVMFSLQGPKSEALLEAILSEKQNSGRLPENKKNRISMVKIWGEDVYISRTGYTGEPNGFEVFAPASIGERLWHHSIRVVGVNYNAIPVGLGTRDTLRMEMGLPLHGHEFGYDPEGNPIPSLAVPLARRVIKFDSGKGDYLGREALFRQYNEISEVERTGRNTKPFDERLIKRWMWPIAVLNDEGDGPGINPVRGPQPQKDGSITYHTVHHEGEFVGWVTSGTQVPYWNFEGDGFGSRITNTTGTRAIGIAYVSTDLYPGDLGVKVQIDKGGGKIVPALLVKDNIRVAGAYARSILYPER